MTLPIWEEGAAPVLGLGPLQGDLEAEVAVVGLGGSGLTAVGELCARGVDTVGLDAGGIASGATGRNGGFLLAGLADFHHVAIGKLGRDRAIACYRATLEELERIFELTPEAASCAGSLRVSASQDEEHDCEAQYAAMAASGLPVERYSGPEGRGLLFANDGILQPFLRCQILARRALEGGARLFVGSPVTSFAPGRLFAATGSVACRSVLVCVDGALEQLVPVLKRSVRSARLQMLATAPVAEAVASRPVYRRFGLDYWRQLATGEVVLGGCRDVGGDDEWTTRAVPSETVQRALDELLTSGLGLDAEVTHRWAGVVGFTDDRLPLVREVAPGLYVAGGYSGTGNIVGTLAARGLVGLALDGHSELAELLDGTAP
jgi:gamma-glutamylputrescine oxidase